MKETNSFVIVTKNDCKGRYSENKYHYNRKTISRVESALNPRVRLTATRNNQDFLTINYYLINLIALKIL